MSAPAFDYAGAAEKIERIRNAIRKAGPDSGLHRSEAFDADCDLAAVRDQLKHIAGVVRQRQEKTDQQQRQQGDLL